MKWKLYVTILILTITGSIATAQTNSPNTAAVDLNKLEMQVLKAADWIIATGLTVELEKRKETNSTVLKWYIDTITLNINLVEKLSAIYGDNSELLMMFFAGYTKFYLENKTTTTNLAATKAGLIALVNVYKKGVGVTKNDALENLVTLSENNKLDDYVKNNLD